MPLEPIVQKTAVQPGGELPSDMKALVLQAPGRLKLAAVPVPAPGPGEALIEVKAATTCGTDLKAYLRGHPKFPMPCRFGHEYSGVVRAVGVGTAFAPGDAVMGVHSAPCGACEPCLRGQQNLCDSIMETMALGSYAQFLLIPERVARVHLFIKPDELSMDCASLLEPLACVAEGLRHVPPGRILVIGPGAIGLMFVAALKLRGDEVVLAGRDQGRLAVGEAFGARAVHPDDAGLHGAFDAVVECTGSVEVWERAPSYARRGGTAVFFGGPPAGSRASFDTNRLHYDQISLISPFHFGTSAVLQAREWLLTPGFDLRPLLSGDRALEEGERTFEDLRARRGLKYVFRP